MAGADVLWASAHLSGAVACLPYVQTHAAELRLDAASCAADSTLPYFDGLRAALRRLREQSPAAAVAVSSLADLLSGSPSTASQHALSEGVFAEMQDTVMAAQAGRPRHEARLRSAAGEHAGSWLAVFPLTRWTTARGRDYQLALCLRLGAVLPELVPVRGVRVRCGGCTEELDEFGFHPGICRGGNRHSLWTIRHDAGQMAIILVSRRMGYAVQAVSVGAGNWFGAAGYRAGRSARSGDYRRADVVYPHYFGPGRHLFLDVAVADPGSGAALGAVPSSRSSSGVAAELRAMKKNDKYKPLAAAVGSEFRAAVLERYGACSDSLVGLFRTLCGDRERDAAACDDYSGLVSSRVSYMASTVVFGTVLADAALVSRVIQLDACGAPPARFAAPASARHGPRAGAPLTQRDVEGEGGVFWYAGLAGDFAA